MFGQWAQIAGWRIDGPTQILVPNTCDSLRIHCLIHMSDEPAPSLDMEDLADAAYERRAQFCERDMPVTYFLFGSNIEPNLTSFGSNPQTGQFHQLPCQNISPNFLNDG